MIVQKPNLFLILILVYVTVLHAKEGHPQCDGVECLGQSKNGACTQCISEHGKLCCAETKTKLKPPPPPASMQSSGSGFRKINKGWILAIVVGIVVCCALIGAVIYLFRRKRTRRRRKRKTRRRPRQQQQLTTISLEQHVLENDQTSQAAVHNDHSYDIMSWRANVQYTAPMERARHHRVRQARNEIPLDSDDYLHPFPQSHTIDVNVEESAKSLLPRQTNLDETTARTLKMSSAVHVNGRQSRVARSIPEQNRFTSSTGRHMGAAVIPGNENVSQGQFIPGDNCIPLQIPQVQNDGSSLLDDLFGPLYMKCSANFRLVATNGPTERTLATSSIDPSQPYYPHEAHDRQDLNKRQTGVSVVNVKHDISDTPTRCSSTPMNRCRQTLLHAVIDGDSDGDDYGDDIDDDNDDDNYDDDDDDDDYMSSDSQPENWLQRPAVETDINDPFPYIGVGELMEMNIKRK
ncbi:uncharacterized protein LOC121375933 [Gigantopelta aegis]|uniref:uncharacterized protein LOC121375933 n=1 Tax=Gigantopelta aegis TaxID=1735272 RepID=UPI001B88E5E4|nr:uncharacterized protein LOC121375933 [Gigantopelta aegis]